MIDEFNTADPGMPFPNAPKTPPKPPVDDMVPLKPPTVPLFDIPPHILRSMSAEAEKDMDKFSNPVDFIMAERKKCQVEVSGPTGLPPATSAPSPQAEQPKIPLVAIDGHVLPGDTVTLLLYSLVTLAKKDKKIAKVLKAFKYIMRDVNGDQLWP